MSAAGIDRWRGGWVVAEADGGDIGLWASPDIAPAIDRLRDFDAVAIDMPIALAQHGRREAESLLRATLGAAARSVFTSPTRAAIEAPDQQTATEVNRAHNGPGISAQAFGLFPSIRELRAALSGAGCDHWYETHPEAAFAMMGGSPLPSKRTALGVAERLLLLREHFPTVDTALLESPAKVPIDDVLDALAAAWSARRIATGDATLFGAPERDDQNFALGIRI